MRFGLSKFALILLVVLFAQFASAARISYKNLVGTWTLQRLLPSGELMAVRLEITPDHTFSGTITTNGAVTWTYSGTFTLKGNQLTWTYVESTKPLPPNFQDTDLILSVKADSFSYSSTSSSETGVYDRVK
jgi:hypothetical protein